MVSPIFRFQNQKTSFPCIMRCLSVPCVHDDCSIRDSVWRRSTVRPRRRSKTWYDTPGDDRMPSDAFWKAFHADTTASEADVGDRIAHTRSSTVNKTARIVRGNCVWWWEERGEDARVSVILFTSFRHEYSVRNQSRQAAIVRSHQSDSDPSLL